jgi:hypothetical protein
MITIIRKVDIEVGLRERNGFMNFFMVTAPKRLNQEIGFASVR